MSEKELAGKVALVTGATRKRGVGRAIACALANAGADVVITGSGAKKPAATLPEDERQGWRGVDDVVEELRAFGIRAHAMNADISNEAEVQQMISQTLRVMGRLDILINNAAFSRGTDRVPVVELDAAVWRQIIDTNLNGTMLCCKYAGREMIRQGSGGAIVSISSGAAVKAPATFSAYAASKAGVHALNSSLACELGPFGITCNVVAPGIIDTARVDLLRGDGRFEKRMKDNPLGRAGKPEEVAELVRFLCGPNARWISGEVIMINGGEVRRAAN
jgi:3-oxoacyl-[acyl-carrier protein] reductase